MKHKSLIISGLLALSTTLGCFNAAAQVTYKDYLRADDVMSYSNYVYSPAVNANWLGESHYFGYKNHEKDGDFFYLVNAENGKKYLAHTLNNTVVAPPRMLIAFLENNLNADGSIRIPEALRMYMGGKESLQPKR